MSDKRIEVLFLKARAAERAGDVATATAIIRRITTAHPGNARARKELARLGKAGEGAGGGANASQPAQAELAAIVALYNGGKMDAVVREAERLLGRYPSSVALLSILGGAQSRAGRSGRAAQAFARAVRVRPDYAEGHCNLGTMLLRQGRLDDAIACYRRAIAIDPAEPDAYGNLGYALKERGKPEEAVAAFRRAIAIRPDHAEAHYNLANTLKGLGRFEEAAASYRQALSIDPDSAESHNNLGGTLSELGRHDEAIASFQRALAIRPDYVDARYNLGSALLDQREPEAAVAAFQSVVAVQPDQARTLTFLGIALTDAGRFDEALDAFDRAIIAEPDYLQPRISAGHVRLLRGEFSTGWPLCKWHDNRPGGRDAPAFARPAWSGEEDVAGKSVFIYHDQGLGDTIQFARYAALLRDRGARVTLSVQTALHPLLRDAFPGVEVIAGDAVPAHFDHHAPLAGLLLAFGTTVETIPAPGAYLAADPGRVEMWRERLGPDGFRIGVCWQGSTGKVDRGRSFAVAQFAGIAALPGVRLISLHKGAGEDQLAALPPGMRVELPGPDFDPEGAAFLDTAAVMEACDLVITSDTSVAHLAGALGVPVWVMLQHVPDWRWMLEREDSPWYPSMRLFRQRTRGDWDSAFAQAEAAVRAMAAAHGEQSA